MSLRSGIRKYIARRVGAPEIPFALERVSRISFEPKLVFDVGAYRGEFARECLRVWPQTKVACFEALPNKVQLLNEMAKQISSVRVFAGLLGAQSQPRVAFNESETASSVLLEQVRQNFGVNYYPMRTVDEIVDEHFNENAPDLLKLDVQGYELEVLKGAEKSLGKVAVILAEVNFLEIHEGVPLLSDMIGWLGARNWVPYDICGLTRRPLDRALWQADFIFVPATSSLRSDKRWQS